MEKREGRILRIAAAVKQRVALLGIYCHEKHEIVLYVPSIERTRRTKTCEQAFEEVFCHEARHGEEIGSTMRIVCQKENGEMHVFVDANLGSGSSALNALLADPRLRSLQSRTTTACFIKRVTYYEVLLEKSAWEDACKNNQTLNDIKKDLDGGIQRIQRTLRELEDILDTL